MQNNSSLIAMTTSWMPRVGKSWTSEAVEPTLSGYLLHEHEVPRLVHADGRTSWNRDVMNGTDDGINGRAIESGNSDACNTGGGAIGRYFMF